MTLVKKVGTPKEHKPPDWIRQEFADGKGPGLAVRKEPHPRNFCDGLGGIAVYIIEFSPLQSLLLGRRFINQQPG